MVKDVGHVVVDDAFATFGGGIVGCACSAVGAELDVFVGEIDFGCIGIELLRGGEDRVDGLFGDAVFAVAADDCEYLFGHWG